MTTPLGLIAGGGDLPQKVIDFCVGTERPIFILAIEGQTPPEIVISHPHAWVPLGAIGKALKHLKQAGVKELVMVGGMRRPSLTELRPDLTGVRWLAKLSLQKMGDDDLLKAIAAQLEVEGFHVTGVESIIGEEYLAPLGPLTTREPSAEDLVSISRGIEVAKILGQADVGQAVVVQQDLVLGVEAIEGTDALINRCATLKRNGDGPILVKCLKPQQEARIDMPVVGLKTLENAITSGFRGIALEAGKTLMLDQKTFIKQAENAGLFVYGFQTSSSK